MDLQWAPGGVDHRARTDSEGEIRRRRAAGEKVVPLGREFGVSHTLVTNIALGKAWVHDPLLGDVRDTRAGTF